VAGDHDLYFLFYNPKIPPQNAVCRADWFAFRHDLPGKGQPDYARINETFTALLNAHVDKTPVIIENGPEQRRTTQVFERGNWLTRGSDVQPGVPESLNPFPEGAPYNRLGLARWLFSKDNPLTARSAVNRFWEQIFGTGIVETLEDFGTQGALPTHPELLDWLALRFMNDHHWSMKKLLKDIVMSATYRQDSRVTQEQLEKDPSNRYLARAPRLRLTAEEIRDQALVVSGLLSEKMFGKSVMPYQPEGVWNTVYNGEKWKPSQGEDRYRRSVYTYAKRTSPYPAMMMFDGSSREVCVSRRIRTDTPLQALVTLNDSSFVVAARWFAKRMMSRGSNPSERIQEGYRQLMVSEMPEAKLRIFLALYQNALVDYRKEQEEVKKITATTTATPDLAALTVVANAMLNLDEVIMKE
jgi:hypothetical protein